MLRAQWLIIEYSCLNTCVLYIGGYGINLSEIENVGKKTDHLSQKLLEHGVTAFCPTIISMEDGYDKVSVYNQTTLQIM